MSEEPVIGPLMVGDALTDAELDEIETAAVTVIDAVAAQDFDTAYIVASTCGNPAMLAMYIAEMTR